VRCIYSGPGVGRQQLRNTGGISTAAGDRWAISSLTNPGMPPAGYRTVADQTPSAPHADGLALWKWLV
jgi:hypothetical protein